MSETTGSVTGVPPEEPLASSVQLAGNLRPLVTASTSRAAPGPSGGVPADGRQEASVSCGVRGTASEPVGDKVGPIPSRPSVMNHPHLAEKLLAAASSPAIREEIRRTNSRVFYREGQTAMLRVVNTFNQALAHVASGDRRIDRYRREAAECRDRATKAEDALNLAQAGEAERHEIVRAQARAEASAAHQQMRKMLERAMAAEGKLMAAEAELADVRTQLDGARSELKSSEEKVEIAEEIARLSDIKAAEAAEAVKAADRKMAEAAEATKAAGLRSAEADAIIQAAGEKMAAAVMEAVESYRRSPIFVEEVADAGADAYLQGFYCCRDKAVRVSGVEGLKELEPEEGDLGVEEARKDSASADDAAPPA